MVLPNSMFSQLLSVISRDEFKSSVRRLHSDRHCKGFSTGNKSKFRFKNKLLSPDATMLELCLSVFDWATYRRAKGAVKMHMLFDHDGYLPRYGRITTGSVHEVNIAHELDLPKGSILAIYRGYNDYSLFEKLDGRGIFFVTRLKANAKYEILENEKLPKNRKITKNQIIRLHGTSMKLRLVEVYDEEKLEWIELITNQLEFGPTTISAIYKDRWQIEIFFRTLKQNFKIKTFVGTSANAVLIQIWTALM